MKRQLYVVTNYLSQRYPISEGIIMRPQTKRDAEITPMLCLDGNEITLHDSFEKLSNLYNHHMFKSENKNMIVRFEEHIQVDGSFVVDKSRSWII